MNAQERRAKLVQVFAGIFEGWEGLPPGCTAEDFASLSTGEINNGMGRISGIQTAFRDYSGHPGPLRVFFDDRQQAFLVWADWTLPSAQGANPLASLGPETAVLEDLPSRRPGTTQHIWSGHGVVAYITTTGEIRGLALFMPAPPEYYSAALGGNETQPYRPLPNQHN